MMFWWQAADSEQFAFCYRGMARYTPHTHTQPKLELEMMGKIVRQNAWDINSRFMAHDKSLQTSYVVNTKKFVRLKIFPRNNMYLRR